jgi:hypothetical protein
MTYTKFPLDPAREAVQLKLTLLVVTAVTWKLPGVEGGVTLLKLNDPADADTGSRSEATVKTAARAQAANLKILPEVRFSDALAAIII